MSCLISRYIGYMHFIICDSVQVRTFSRLVILTNEIWSCVTWRITSWFKRRLALVKTHLWIVSLLRLLHWLDHHRDCGHRTCQLYDSRWSRQHLHKPFILRRCVFFWGLLLLPFLNQIVTPFLTLPLSFKLIKHKLDELFLFLCSARKAIRER